MRFGLRSDADVICEKPLVLNPWNIDALEEIEAETGRKVFNILQLRLHPAVIALREKVRTAPRDEIFDVDLTYLTSRGRWYHVSWKGDVHKSGGIATNIGVHFYDMLSWVFGDLKSSIVHFHRDDVAAGYLEYERARVRWFLSINDAHLPQQAVAAGKRTYRSIMIGDEELEFSDGFTDLHTASYQAILDGRGFGLNEARNSIDTVFRIRQEAPVGLRGEYHPFCQKLAGD